MTTLLIHGANSSRRSFNYLCSKVKLKDIRHIEYDVSYGFFKNLNRMIDELDSSGKYDVISHSMGGIYAIHLSKYLHFRKSISIAAPFDGASIADWAKYMMPYYALFRDVGTYSFPIRQAKEIKIEIPWLQIVTTRGNVPWLKVPNDGVLTVQSMTSRKDVNYIYLEENHYEIMLSDRAANEISSFLFG